MKHNVDEMLTAIASHYLKPDGMPINATLEDVESLPEFQKRFPAAVKAQGNDQNAATLQVMEDLCFIGEEVTELPVHVLNPTDYDYRRGRGGGVVMAEGGLEPVWGVRIVLPDGRQRFLRNVDDATRASLHPGAAAKMRGSIEVRRDLVDRSTSYRIGAKSEIVAESHDEPFPHLGLDNEIGEFHLEKGWGPWNINPKTNILTGRFGPHFKGTKGYDAREGSLYVTARVAGVYYVDAKKGTVAVFLESHDGYTMLTEWSQRWVQTHFGVAPDSERVEYFKALKDQWILSNCAGSIFSRIVPRDEGGVTQAEFDAELDRLRNEGLLERGSDGRERLVIPEGMAEPQKEAGDFPHVMFADRKVYDIEVSPDGWVDVYEMGEVQENGTVRIDLRSMERDLPKKDGGTYTRDAGYWCVPIQCEDSARIIDATDPAYAELQALRASRM